MNSSPFLQFLDCPDWDAPFFKKLAHNDTGAAAGNQAGMVLPKDLRMFLPNLDEAATSSIAPTTDRYLRTELFVEMGHVSDRRVRYQFQTWGGTRSPESRLTDGFQPLRNCASANDLVIFQRRLDVFDMFRLILVRQGTTEFAEVANDVGGRRWGTLFLDNEPVGHREFALAVEEIAELSQGVFQTVRPIVTRVETRQNRIARCSVFRARVGVEYERACAVSGIKIVSPSRHYEVESAHIVPVSKGGTEDVRNGFSLSQSLHWAFDKGLFGVRRDRTVYIPRQVRSMEANNYLRQFENRIITEARTASLRVHSDAFDWHFQNLVRQWD